MGLKWCRACWWGHATCPKEAVEMGLSVGCIVNCRQSGPACRTRLGYEVPVGAQYICLGINDLTEDDKKKPMGLDSKRLFATSIRCVASWMHHSIQQGKHVIVHCTPGHSGLALLLWGVVMIYNRMSYADAVSLVKQQRSLAFAVFIGIYTQYRYPFGEKLIQVEHSLFHDVAERPIKLTLNVTQGDGLECHQC